MADILQIGQFVTAGPLSQPQRFVADFDLNPGTGVSALVRDTLVITAPEETAIYAKNERRYGGSRRVAESHDNGQVEFELYLKGATADASLALFDGITAITEDTTTTRYLRWRPDGSSRSVYYEIRGNAWDPKYRWIEFSATRTLHIALTLKVAPLAFGDPYDVFDDYAADTITAGDYTFGTGGGTLSVSGGQLVPSSTAAKRAVHTGRGYTYTDSHITMKMVVGASAAGNFGLVGKYIDDNNYIYAQLTTASIKIFKVVAGVTTQLASAAASNYASGKSVWLRLRIEDNVITAEVWDTIPISYNGATSGTQAAVTSVLSAADAAVFGRGIAGSAGFFITPGATDYRYDDFRVDPFTYYRRKYPDTVNLYGVPGTAPASVDTVIYSQSNAGTVPPAIVGATPKWTLLTWTPLPEPNNMIWQGNWETSFTTGSAGGGWLTAALTGFAASTSVASQASGATFGSRVVLHTIPNTASAVSSFPIYQKFYAGKKYTVQMYVQPSSAGAPIRMSIVPGPTPNSGDSAFVETSTTGSPTLLTTTWIPQQDWDYAYVTIGNNGTLPGAIRTITTDGLVVYEGATAPTQATHMQGDGAIVPFGVIQGEAYSNDLGLTGTAAFTTPADTTMNGGFSLTGPSANGWWLSYVNWTIDPNLLTPDDFSGEVTLEVWGRIQYDNAAVGGLTATLRAIPYSGASGGLRSASAARYTKEYGTSGKSIPQAQGGGGWRYLVVRLGTITLPVGDSGSARWALSLNLQPANGPLAGLAEPVLDYLFISRAKSRALLPTGKPNDSTYPPTAFPGYQRVTRELASTGGSWAATMAPSIADGLGPSGPLPGLGGQLVEFPPGNVAVGLMWFDGVPDDTVVSAGTGPTPTTVYWAPTVHFSIIPRYYLTRSA